MQLDKQLLEKQKRASELELEGLKKLQEARAILSGYNGGEVVVGDPQPTEVVLEGTPGETEMVLALPQNAKEASLKILASVMKEVEASEDENVKKLFSDLDDVKGAIEKNAYAYEWDTDDVEKEIHESFVDRVIEDPDKSNQNSFMEKFKGDDSREVAKLVKKQASAPFQKVEG